MLRRLLAVAAATLVSTAAAQTTVPAQMPGPAVVTFSAVVPAQAPATVPAPAVVPAPASAPVVIYSSEPAVISGPVVYSRPRVYAPRPQPAVGLGAVNSPFYFYPELTIGGPGYMYRSTPPHNGWSSGYRGAYYGEPVPGAASRRGPWSR